MNSIQNHVCVGDVVSVARAREAVENKLIICNSCYTRLEFATAVGPFIAGRVEMICKCYMCEGRAINGFKVSRTV